MQWSNDQAINVMNGSEQQQQHGPSFASRKAGSSSPSSGGRNKQHQSSGRNVSAAASSSGSSSTVTGKGGKAAAASAVTEDLEWKEVSRKQKRISVPSTAISRVIGRGGCNINAVREYSGAHIEVEKQKGTAGGSTHRDQGKHGSNKECSRHDLCPRE